MSGSSVPPVIRRGPREGPGQWTRWVARAVSGPALARPWLLDLELAWYGLALTVIVVGRVATQRPIWATEYRVMTGLAACCAVVALVRWWAPRWTGPAAVTVLAVGVAVLAVRPLGPLGPLRLTLSIAIAPVLLVAVARRSRWWWVAATMLLAGTEVALDAGRGGNTLSIDLAHWLLRGDPTPQFVWVTGALLLVAPVAVGLLLRSGDAARRAEAQARRAETLARVRAEERLQVARELHDLVANHVTGVIVAAQAAGLAPELPSATGRALDEIEAAGNRALAAMRRMVGALRARHDVVGNPLPDVLPAAQATALAAVRAAIAGADGEPVDGVPSRRETPDDVVFSTAGDTEAGIAADVGITVHRIVVEALTNARRHTPTGARIAVALTTPRAGVLAVEVVNPVAPGRVGIRGGGYGLVGLHERAAAVGGRLEAGPTAGGRWCLRAELPQR